jgi:nicotinic acid mononucleotide adenylyltransferase
MFTSIKKGAASRKIEFNITIEYLWELFLQQNKKCALSGMALSFADTRKNKNKKKTVSVDRIDSSKGYINGNVQWVHKTINIMKNSLSDEEFIEFCRKVSEKNSHKDGPYSLFIGRFQPPHIGHMFLFNEALKNNKKALIAIRDIEPDEKNPLEPVQVKELWEKIYEGNNNVKVMIIPDIESVNWGRGVGYQTLEHVPPTDICNVSATQIRNFIKEGSDEWKMMVNEKIHNDIEELLK